MGWVRAQTTFHADGPRGAPFAVAAGEVFPDSDERVALMFQRDPEGAAKLFAPLDTGEPEAPAAAPKPRARAAKGTTP